MNDDAEIQRAVRRTVGIAALRRLRRMVDAEEKLEASKALWARRLTLVLALTAVLAVVCFMIR